jgi:hypothetical protein
VNTSAKLQNYSDGFPLFFSITNNTSVTINDRYVVFSATLGTYVYDVMLDKWYIWKETWEQLISKGDEVIGISSNGEIDYICGYTYNDQDSAGEYKEGSITPFTWYFASKCFMDGIIGTKKSLSKLYVMVDMPAGSTLDICYSLTHDKEDYTNNKLYSFTASSDVQNLQINIPVTKLHNIDYYRLIFVGQGACTIHYLSKEIRVRR